MTSKRCGWSPTTLSVFAPTEPVAPRTTRRCSGIPSLASGVTGISRAPRRVRLASQIGEVYGRQRQRGGEPIHTIEQTAVPRQEIAAVFHAGHALHPGLEQIADDTEPGHEQRENQ